MALTTLQQLTDLVSSASNRRRAYHYISTSGNTNALNSGWTLAKTGYPLGGSNTSQTGAVPATGAGAACDRTTVGAVVVPGASPAGGNAIYLGRWLPTWGSGRQRVPLLVDRLVHTSGLSGTVTAVQTVNSAALPRFTTGDRVEAALEWYTATGATPTTATIVYVDDQGVSRTTTMNIPASPAAGQIELIPHISGVQHRGIRSITSVQLAATTGTAGNFGVTLFRRLCHGRIRLEQDPLDWRVIGIPQVDYNACLSIITAVDSSGTMNLANEFVFVEA